MTADSPMPPSDRPVIRTRVPVTIAGGHHVEFVSFDHLGDDREHIAVLFPGWDSKTVPLCRVHSECLTGDVFGSRRCDCGPQLEEAVDRMGREGGILLYLKQEGRGIGLYNKLDAYKLQIEQGTDTYRANIELGFAADQRDWAVAARMLGALGVSRIRLFTNNPEKRASLAGSGIAVAEIVPTGLHLTDENRPYLKAKRAFGHQLPDPEDT